MPTVTAPTKVIELDFGNADRRMTQLRERHERLRGRHAAMRQHVFDLDAEHTRLLGEVEIRRRSAERQHGRELPRLPALPPGLTREARDNVMRQFGEQIEAVRTMPATAADDAARDLARLDEMLQIERETFAELSAATSSARRDVTVAEQWLARRHSLPTAPAPFVVLPDPAYADAELDELRSTLADLVTQVTAIERAPVSRAEAMRRLDAAIAAAATPALDVNPFVAPTGSGVLVSGVLSQPGSSTGWWASLAAVVPEAVRELAEAQIEAHYAGLPDGVALSADERRRRLDDLEQRRRAIEYSEEALIRSGGDTASPRRHDARPEFLLGSNIGGTDE